MLKRDHAHPADGQRVIVTSIQVQTPIPNEWKVGHSVGNLVSMHPEKWFEGLHGAVLAPLFRDKLPIWRQYPA